jgi:diguanylate cyclase (GGDEF)-like protein
VAFIDLDNFKLVNDSLGHNAGDEVLMRNSSRMAACLRATDTLMRLGGDEFVIVLADQPKGAETISCLLQKLRVAIADPLLIDGHTLRVTGSIGVANYPNDGTDARTLLANADAAMYRAKQIGRDNFQFYTADLDIKARERLQLHEELREAVANNEFVLFYQPQLDLQTGNIFAVEALVRWRHSKLGLVSPEKFIPMAEQTGLIVPIGDWVLREACRQNKAWQDNGLPRMTVCVNVSARQFNDRTLIAKVIDALQKSGLAAKYLELEVTESLIMQDARAAAATMEALRGLGVQLSIDDFGTGYSSLSALSTFPVGRLKIDKSFITDLMTNGHGRTVASAVISLGRKLKLKVLAEGVETAEQLEFLRENNCDEVQGYHLSRPIAAKELEELLINTTYAVRRRRVYADYA